MTIEEMKAAFDRPGIYIACIVIIAALFALYYFLSWKAEQKAIDSAVERELRKHSEEKNQHLEKKYRELQKIVRDRMEDNEEAMSAFRRMNDEALKAQGKKFFT